MTVQKTCFAAIDTCHAITTVCFCLTLKQLLAIQLLSTTERLPLDYHIIICTGLYYMTATIDFEGFMVFYL